MNHRPFEEWLLNDELLTPDQDHELQQHLRDCPKCASLEKGNLFLRSSAVMPPPEGFGLRFQARLQARRQEQQRKTMIGIVLLVLTGITGLIWRLFPYFPLLELPPGQLLNLWISFMISVVFAVEAVGALSLTILKVLQSLIPGYIWFILTVFIVAVSFFWSYTLRKTGIFVQSATEG